MNNTLKDAYEQYKNLGFVLQKSAKHKKHAHRKGAYIERENEKWENDATGYVAIIPKGIIIVDNDKYMDEGASMSKLIGDLGVNVEPFAITPSGGEHYAFNNPHEDLVIGNLSKEYPALDIYAGYQSVIPIVGTTVKNKQGALASYSWADDVMEEFIVNEFVPSMKDLFKMRSRAEGIATDYEEDFGLAIAIKEDTMPESEVDELLKTIPAEIDYDTWLAVAMSLFDRYEGGEDGLAKLLAFGAKSEKDDANHTENKWRNGHFKTTQKFTRLRSIAHEFAIANVNDEIAKASPTKLKKIIKEVSQMKHLNTRSRMDAEARDELATSINSRMKELKVDDDTVKVIQARTLVKELTYEMPEEEVKKELDGEKDWLSNIAYIESFNNTSYVLLDTGERLGVKGLGGRFANELEAIKKVIAPKSKARMTMDGLLARGMFQVCGAHEYNPQENKKIFMSNSGILTYNLYKADTRPVPATEYTEHGIKLVESFVGHINTLMHEDEAKTLLDWLAWSAQNFGEKVLWTPLIQSAEGLGKSIIGNVMINHVFGSKNAGTVDSNVVVSPQTSWATGGVLRVLEEIKLAGHNRFEVLNQLKPFITNDTVSRVEKYETSMEVRNFTNFLAFTNFKDAIPVSADDRRWWVVFSKLNSIEELELATGINRMDYFAPLHELVEKDSPYGAEFYKYLMERDVSAFDPKFPPMSMHKARMRATEDSKTVNLIELRDLIAQESKGVTEDIVSTRQLKKLMLSGQWEHNTLDTGETTTLLRKLGYTKFPKQVKSEEQVHNVWFKNAGLSDKEVRAQFHESMKLEIQDGFEDLDAEDL